MDIELKQKLDEITSKIRDMQKYLEIEVKRSAIQELEEKLQEPDLWQNQELYTKLSQELKEAKNIVAISENWDKNLSDCEVLIELAQEDKESLEETITP